ncbi:hypothetical protein [Paenibacillus sp. Soil522]|uniref:hypothetical protein n=1 Tax=Paenibacillus sp. Soil522 TaxID=1736388 RepID=UPI000AE34ECF|nr:hypothetical protein [Paenibacillus sp. Soil522]
MKLTEVRPNQFRSERMKVVLEKVFTAVLQFLAEENDVKRDHYFVVAFACP